MCAQYANLLPKKYITSLCSIICKSLTKITTLCLICKSLAKNIQHLVVIFRFIWTVCCGAQLPICFLFALEAMHVSGLEVVHTSVVCCRSSIKLFPCVFFFFFFFLVLHSLFRSFSLTSRKKF